ncbi:MAG: hypothetical protein K5886_11380, partial [Lachnospiraceae bacterium]|nr:hypothetical protein [Lachnospiraceae bacterium]
RFELVSGAPTGSAAGNFMFLADRIRDEEFIMFCDQDDVWLKDKIQLSYDSMVRGAGKENAPKAVFSDLIVAAPDLKILHDSYFEYESRDVNKLRFNDLIKKNVAPGCTMMINRAMLELLKKHRELCYFTMHDWAVMILASLYGEISVIDKGTALYRQHSDNQVGAENKTGIYAVKRFLFEFFTFKKLRYIKDSVLLEKRIIAFFIASVDDRRDPGFSDTEKYRKILSGNKIARMSAYVSVNDCSFRSMVRALFV